MPRKRFTYGALAPNERLSPCMVGILSALRENELHYTELKSKLTNPETKKPYTDRALSLNLDNLERRGLVERPKSVGHRPYRITEKGIEEVLKVEDYRFSQQNTYYKAFDIKPFAPIPPPLRSSSSWKSDEYINASSSSGRLENLEIPEKIISDYIPIFPLHTRAIVKLNENGRLALEPWLERMRGKYGIDKDNEEEQEWLHQEIVDTFADPIIKKLCEILFERARALSALYSDKDTHYSKNYVPTLYNIMNFNFEFALRYSGENWLKSASKEDVEKVQHLLAGMILLYLAGSGGGPLESFSWQRPDIDTLVETQILTKQEVEPLLKTCREIRDDFRVIGNFLNLEELSDSEKRRLTMSAFRRFYLGGLFGDCMNLSWEDRLELLPFMKVFQKYMNDRARKDLVEDLGKDTGYHTFRKDRVISECSRVLLRPETEVESLFGRLAKLDVFVAIKEEPGVYLWNTDASFRLFR